ncbi:ABC transporter permease [Bacillus subtilis]|nr:ABC transporter permease [Bacillus subtilis]UWJ03350.1 ABC transporter permease [Bacillus subtilis]WOP27634.1 ABC transporter permease [Bacillus subtilis]
MKLFNRKVTLVSLILMAVFQFFMALIIKRIVISAGTDENFIGYLSYTPSLNILLQALTIVIAATIVSMEFDKKTIKFLLIRPVKRQKVFWSKLITVVMVSFYLYLAYYILALLFGLVFFGTSVTAESKTLLVNTLALIGSNWLEAVMMGLFGLLCSSLFRNSAVAVVVSFVVLYGASTLVQLMKLFENKWGSFLLFANTDFRQYGSGETALFSGMTPLFSIGILIIHAIFFIVVGWWCFCKRDVRV